MIKRTFIQTLLTLLVAAIAMLAAAPVEACGIAQAQRLQIDSSLPDVSPPSAPEAQLEVTQRGSSGAPLASSCDDLGAFSIGVSGASDAETPTEQLGYMVRPADADFEALLGNVDGIGTPILAYNGTLMFVWIDGADQVQEALDLELHVHAVDEAGNESTDFAVVMLSDPGRKGPTT